MIEFDSIAFCVAGHFLPAIVNDDYTALDADEEDQLDAFIASCHAAGNSRGHFAVLDEGGEGFARCDICGLLANCETLEYLFPVASKQE